VIHQRERKVFVSVIGVVRISEEVSGTAARRLKPEGQRAPAVRPQSYGAFVKDVNWGPVFDEA
jgi:hypothetical protein